MTQPKCIACREMAIKYHGDGLCDGCYRLMLVAIRERSSHRSENDLVIREWLANRARSFEARRWRAKLKGRRSDDRRRDQGAEGSC